MCAYLSETNNSGFQGPFLKNKRAERSLASKLCALGDLEDAEAPPKLKLKWCLFKDFLPSTLLSSLET